ncbi:hypothetical protein A3D84_02345 [Candidatus Woesebacteria bacterium RIFCSPHIGHO2_02_FULL_42_20]|uniref:Membrane protein 6-pyruvoyl-tetrahydropterin synthase-related domain-containing protein n=1 Tax=Candidatus Woesebacteria bacterium RIFCSPHIGHO2_12_FULL_41_24 TaxID=1802510 RepID=A0A1F8ATH2_9BACT|nr:MAG: hypothetical protein A2W15_00085 [Candidatus Woesebacteria bacterium RBG_16_41_13]OGM29429.1 MAG: hypothetical protein A2873_05050 [Candidatus Woesebacteria bacterium RIFCSPHIGHO2_01_FULL_42_80]OGM35008.1 MAG: hypothetical protein A3D84_02345 [Candidatus Woesebacteria bacterium RIFCSPHIGHO2_02_FULL_42_20]OGM54799.1 MAG: hypothetical protein A3E44_01420 [Candidatus Woesebacteria bacterium RIFCSPHIGHO2_12_FULL_41_24]OGM68323.1 MAG: hypothetical protein A2969_02960 [Candidatus Woesebacteri
MKAFFSLILFAAIIPLVFYISYSIGHLVLEGEMMGGDTAYHLSWIHTLQRYFPKIPMWFPFAGGGQSITMGYWVFPYYIAIVIDCLSNLTVEQAVRLLEFLAVPVVALQIYIYIWIRLKNQFIASVGALLYPLSSLAWGWVTQAGFFGMHLSTVTLLPVFLFFDLYLNSELVEPQKVLRKRLFLLGFSASLTIAILMHGSAMPSLLLGFPLYTMVRSQLNPRIKEARLYSFFRSVKALLICIIFGILTSFFFLYPQLKYFAFQTQGQKFGYGLDIPFLTWKGLLGFELMDPYLVGSLHTPLYLSTIVGLFSVVGVGMSIIKRHFISAMGVTSLFYLVWITNASFIKERLPFLDAFLDPTNVRSSSTAAIYFTILAAFGIWSLVDIPGAGLRYFIGRLGKIPRLVITKITLVSANILVIPFAIWMFIEFQNNKIFPGTDKGRDYINYGYASYPGFKTLDPTAPFCNIYKWQNGISDAECGSYKPKYTIDKAGKDSAPQNFEADVANLDLDKLARVSVSPNLGSLAFSWADHSRSSMLQTPSSQATPIISWLGIHNEAMFLYSSEGNSQEVSEVAKWFGVKYAFLNRNKDKFALDNYSSDYWLDAAQAGSGENVIKIKELENTPGMISISDKPSVLVIGSLGRKAYTDVYRVATKGAFSFDRAYLIQGTEKIDDYSLNEIKQFSVVVLHGYSYDNFNEAWGMLKKYVEDGGSLFIDTGWQYVSKDWGKDEDTTLPDPAPITKTLWGNVGLSWDGATLAGDYGESFKLEKFAPPLWSDMPWGMAIGKMSSLRPWAEPVLRIGDKVIVAKGNYGKGRVLWSGMNMLVHVLQSGSSEEFRLLRELFNFLIPKEEITKGEVMVNWDDPDRVYISLLTVPTSPSFLYFTDSYTPDWRAYLLKGNQKTDLKIYRAGPGFKGVWLSQLQGGEKVIFEYSITKNVLIGAFFSITSVLIIIYSIIDSLFLKGLVEKKIRNFKRRIHLWDEEE